MEYYYDKSTGNVVAVSFGQKPSGNFAGPFASKSQARDAFAQSKGGTQQGDQPKQGDPTNQGQTPTQGSPPKNEQYWQDRWNKESGFLGANEDPFNQALNLAVQEYEKSKTYDPTTETRNYALGSTNNLLNAIGENVNTGIKGGSTWADTAAKRESMITPAALQTFADISNFGQDKKQKKEEDSLIRLMQALTLLGGNRTTRYGIDTEAVNALKAQNAASGSWFDDLINLGKTGADAYSKTKGGG